MQPTALPTIAGHNLANDPFPAGFVFKSGHPTIDAEVAILIANVHKCYAATPPRPDIALTLIYSLQTCGGEGPKALAKALQAGAWTAEDGKALAVLDGQFSNQSGPKDTLTVFKALGLQNLSSGPKLGHHPA